MYILLADNTITNNTSELFVVSLTAASRVVLKESVWCKHLA